MTDGSGLLILLAMLAMPIMAQSGFATCDMWNRAMWCMWWAGVAVTLAMSLVNPWAALVVACLLGGALTVVPREQAWPRALYPGLMAASAWLALAPLASPAWVRPVVLTMVAMGLWMGSWALYSHWRGLTAYTVTWGRLFGLLPRPLFIWHEDSPTHLKAGQGNANHLQGLAVLSLAALAALVWLDGPWWLVTLPLLSWPVLVRVNKEGIFSQAHLHLVTLGVTVASLALPWPVGLALWGLYGLGGLLLTQPWSNHRRNWDGCRFALWHLAIRQLWWPSGWRRRLVGFGTATWEPVTAQASMKEIGGVVFTTAHNEYIQFLVEHGLVGALCLAAYGGHTLWRLATGGPEAHALLLVVSTLASIATGNFPWSWFHEIPQPPTCHVCHKLALPPNVPAPETHCRCPEPRQLGPTQPLYVGSPGLVAWSLVLAILIEAF